MVQRHAADPPCALGTPVSAASRALYEPANDIIEQLYKANHRGHAVLTGSQFEYGGRMEVRMPRGTKGRRAANRILRDLRGRSRQLAPDIVDFTDRVFYEIKTVNYVAQGTAQLQSYYHLAEAIRQQEGGLPWNQDFATWYPPHNLTLPGSLDHFVCTMATNYGGSTTGLILYQILRRPGGPDPVPIPNPEKVPEGFPEALIALALLGAAAKAGAKKFGTRLIPGYAYASALAGIVLLASRKAEAHIGPGEDPLETLFRTGSADGAPVPPEIRRMITSDPELRAIVEDGMRGDPTDAQRRLNERLLAIIRQNPEAFTSEDLKLLLSTTEAARGSIPEGDVTVETLRLALDVARTRERPREAAEGDAGTERAGDAGRRETDGRGGGAAQAREIDRDLRERLNRAGPVLRLYKALTGPQGQPVTSEALRRFLLITSTTPSLTDEEVDRLISMTQAAPEASMDELLDSVERGVQQVVGERVQPAEGERAVEGGTGEGVEGDEPSADEQRAVGNAVAERLKQLEPSLRRLEQGKWVIIMPPGTRSGEPATGFFVARRSSRRRDPGRFVGAWVSVQPHESLGEGRWTARISPALLFDMNGTPRAQWSGMTGVVRPVTL